MTVVCLGGMHRSGTSLMSSYLLHCGVYMGDEMLDGRIGNKYGLFEDRSFLELHKNILKNNRTYTYIPKTRLIVSESEFSKAQALFKSYNKKYKLWGWKDPRTSLFLNMWDEVDSNNQIRYLLMYREPYSVVDSLCRRLIKYKSPYQSVMPVLGCKAWLKYNKSVIDFFQSNKEKCMLVNIKGCIKDQNNSSALITKWLNIENKDFSDVYHSKEMGNNTLSYYYTLYKKYMDVIYKYYSSDLEDMYSELEGMADITSKGVTIK